MLNNFLSSPIFWIGVNLASFIVASSMIAIPNFKNKFLKIPRLLQQASVFLISGPPCILSLLPQPRFTLFSSIVLAIGITLVVGALIVETLAFRQTGIIPSIKPKGKLVTTGVYGMVRHPIYLGVVLLALGSALVFRATYALMYTPVLTILFYLFTIFEEKELEKEYGDEYRHYKKEVPMYNFIRGLWNLRRRR